MGNNDYSTIYIEKYIPVELTGTRHVRLTVYDLSGRLVQVLADKFMGTGRHEIPFDGSDLASGAYYYRLEGGGPVQTRSMMLVKLQLCSSRRPFDATIRPISQRDERWISRSLS